MSVARRQLSRFFLALLLVCCFGEHGQAQEEPLSLFGSPQSVSSSQQTAGYPVTGRMICADTQKAARFAQITLIPAASGEFGGRRLNARTDLDGNFLIPNAPAGDYYVTGNLAGYVNQSSLVARALNENAEASTLASVPLLHVAAGGASTFLSLTRGAVLAGSVTWDDGTPAAGVNVSAQAASTSEAAPGQFGVNNRFFQGNSNFAQTDDRGRFRIAGLAAGSYYLRATVLAPAPQRPGDTAYPRILSITVYAPDKVRHADATPLTLTAGEERTDLAVVLGVSTLHTVTGTVSSSGAAVRSGNATLTDQTDPTLSRNVRIGPDGSFTIPYVPAGTYTLQINASSLALTDGRGNRSDAAENIRFQPSQTSLTVTDSDLTNLSITVIPVAPTQ